MHKPVFALAFVSLVLLQAPGASAQMKPGLWEMKTKSDAMKNMPAIPPEQVEQMRKMGVTMPQVVDGAMVSKVCVTKQMAEKQQLPGIEKNDMGCQSRNMQRTGNGYTADIVCNSDMMKGTGKAKASYTGNESFVSSYDFKGTVGGQPANQRSETSGRWLAADCGSVKPAQ